MLTPIGPTAMLLAGWLDAAYDNPKIRGLLSTATLTYGVVVALLIVPLLLMIFCSPHDDTRWLWAHVAVLLIAADFLLRHWRDPKIHRLVPSIVLALISVNVYLGGLSIPPLAGKTWMTLAPTVTASLAPDEPLVTASGLSPRNLVYLSRRRIVEIRDMKSLLAILPTTQACLVREKDWDNVPADLRDQFYVADQCVVQKNPPVFSLDLSKNHEPALLVVRKPIPAATQSTNATTEPQRR